MTRPLYFDHNASTPVDPRVLDCFVETERACFANPGSAHGAGRRARAVLEDARATIAEAFQVAAGGVVFVSGGTEANNLAVRGLGDPSLPVLLAPLEHPSVAEPARVRGAEWWAVDPEGRAIVDRPERPVGVVCLVHGQSELGTLQPVAAAGRLARELGVPLHVDASQTVGRVPVGELRADAATIAVSGHKIGGLRGAGALVSTVDVGLRPLLHGGGQESGRRPGTPSPALAAATALAVRLAIREREQRAARMQAARDGFVRLLVEMRPALRCLTPRDALPNTAMILFDGIDGRSLLPALDLAGVHASHGSACSTGSPQPPRVLTEIGLSQQDARRCVRFSFAHDTSADDVGEGARRVIAVLDSLRSRSPR